MYKRVLVKMRVRVREGKLTVPTHAFRAMMDDSLMPSDLKHCILFGEIAERQWDMKWHQWKYVISGEATDGRTIEVVAKLGVDDTIVITVYRVF